MCPKSSRNITFPPTLFITNTITKEAIPAPYYPNIIILITSKKVKIGLVPSFMKKFSK